MPDQSPEDLYGLPLPEFIPERAALVKALRADKRRDEATAVAALRKPSVAAWAVNQLVRTQASTVRKLFKAGDELAEAQSGATGGASAADAMRAATGRQREAIGELVEAARGLLSSDGHPLAASTLERVTETLRAASIDGDSRAQVESGCLERELGFAGLGIGELSAPAPESAPKRAAKEKPKRPTQREAEEARERRAALAAARKTEAEARRAATRAEKELSAAQTAQQDAAAALKEAEERLADASKRAETTATELEKARRALSELDS